MTSTLKLTANCQLEAAGKPDAPRRFTASPAYSGGPIGGYTLEPPLRGEYVLDLETLQPRNERIVATLDHVPGQRVGHVTEIQNDGETLSLSGIVSAKTPAAIEFVASSDEGFPWSASIEAALDRPKLEKDVFVNGQLYPEIYVARNVKLSGVSFVTAGADSHAVAIAASHNFRGKNMSTTSPISVEEQSLVLQRCESIKLHCSEFQTQLNRIKESALTRDSFDVLDFEADLVELQERDAQLHELRANTIKAGEIDNTNYGHPPTAHLMEAALAETVGLPNLETHYDSRILEAAHTHYRGNLGLQQILLRAASENGYRAEPGSRISSGNLPDILRAAFQTHSLAASGFSTTDIGGILGNVANKSLLAGWLEGDQSWRQVSQIKPVSNFHPATSYRLLDDLEYSQVGEAGEIQHGTLDEQSYTRQAKTFAKMVTLTREAIINDDLSAFDDLRIRLGRGALAKFNQVFWSTFLADANFFKSANGNVITDALDAGGVGLEAAILRFRKLLSPDGKSIDGEPVTLLVPPELEFVGRKLFQSTNVVITGSTDATSASANPFAGLYAPLVQRRLSDTTFTNSSATGWYLLRNPQIAAVVAVSFLNGQEQPTIETSDVDFSQLGISFRGFHDWGVDLTTDFLAGVKSDGSI